MISRWAEINAPQPPSEEKTVIPADGGLRGGKLRRESKDLRWGTKSAINYVHLLNSRIVLLSCHNNMLT